MKLEALVRLSLYATAPLNVLAGFLFAFPHTSLAAFLRIPADSHPFYNFLSGGMVALFGLSYFWLASQRTIFRPLLLVGACGKLLAAGIAIGLYLLEQLAAVTAVAISGDLFLAGLWFYYLATDEPD